MRVSLHRLVIGLILASGCVFLGSLIPTLNQARGEVTSSPPQPAFEPTSVPVLREMSATLHQIDGRLARLETIARKLQMSATAKPAAGGDTDSN